MTNSGCGLTWDTTGESESNDLSPVPSLPSRPVASSEPSDLPFPGEASADSIQEPAEGDDDWREWIAAEQDEPGDLAPEVGADLNPVRGISAAEAPPGHPVARLRVRRMRRSADRSIRRFADGSTDRWFGRIHVMPLPWVQAGAVGEKDPGEQVKHGYASAFLRIGRPGGMELIAGDYRVEAGSRLLLSRQSFASPGARVFRSFGTLAGPLRPHASAGENSFFRGVAARLPIRLASLSADAAVFASSVKRHGRIDTAGTFHPHLTGLFRSTAEIERRNTLLERAGGAVLAFQWSGLRVALAGLWTDSDCPVRFQGRSGAVAAWTGTSAEASFTGRGFEVGGEVAHSGATALTLEGRVMPSRRLSATLQIQKIQPGFLAPNGTEITGRSAEGNSSACVLACKLGPTRWLRASCVASVNSSARPRGQDPLPSTRLRLSADTEITLAPGWSVLAFAGTVRSDDGITVSDPAGRSLRVLRGEDRTVLRLQTTTESVGLWSIRNRCELVAAVRASQGERERGVLLQTDLKFRIAPGVRASFRGSLFDVSGWGARIYCAEEDVEGAMRIPVFVGRGGRLYALLRWALVPAVALSCRFGVTSLVTLPRGDSLEADAAEEECELSLQLDAVW